MFLMIWEVPKHQKTLISYRFYNVFGQSLKSSIIWFSLKIRVRSKATDLHTVSFLSSDPAGNICQRYSGCLKNRAGGKVTHLLTVSFLSPDPAGNISVSVTPTAFKTRVGSKVTHLLTVSFLSSDPAGNISFRGCVLIVVATQRYCISTAVTTPFSGEFPPAQRRRDLE